MSVRNYTGARIGIINPATPGARYAVVEWHDCVGAARIVNAQPQPVMYIGQTPVYARDICTGFTNRVEDLPLCTVGVWYIVTVQVAEQLKGTRDDLLKPATPLFRTTEVEGGVSGDIYCTGLQRV
jgi:hypothetical protein